MAKKGNYNYFTLDSQGNIIGYSLKDYALNPESGEESLGNRIGFKALAVISAPLSEADVVSSIPVLALDNEYIVAGDILAILNPDNLQSVQTLVCTIDTISADTSIFVESATLANDLLEGCIVAIQTDKKLYSERLQTGSGNAYEFTQILHVRTNSIIAQEATTNGLAGSGTANRIIVPESSAMECEFKIVVCKEDAAAIARMVRRALFKNVAGTITRNAPATTPYADEINPELNGVAVAISANVSEPCIKVDVTGLNLTLLNFTVFVHCIVSKYG